MQPYTGLRSILAIVCDEDFDGVIPNWHDPCHEVFGETAVAFPGNFAAGIIFRHQFGDPYADIHFRAAYLIDTYRDKYFNAAIRLVRADGHLSIGIDDGGDAVKDPDHLGILPVAI